MTREQFIHLQAEKVVAGQHQLAQAARGLLLRADPDIYDVLSDAPDETFLEPLLFAYFNASRAGPPRIGLPQIILGYVDESMRPDAIEVYADARGIIYLPRIGYFLSEARERSLVLRWERETGRYFLEQDDAPVPFHFEELLTIPGTSIELCRHSSPLVDAFLSDATAGRGPVELEPEVERYLGPLARALAIIKSLEPEYYRDLTSTVRQLVLFRSEALNSCASLAVHGAAFLNVHDGDDEVFFVEDLVHQCGHVIFNAVSVRRKDFLAVDPETPIHVFSGRTDDPRSVYTLLHGSYTEYFMTECLRACEERQVFSGRRAHELRGRLASICQKGMIDLKNRSHEGLFTPLGQSLHELFARYLEEVHHEQPELLRYDLSNQPYNFSYERFVRLNPPNAEPVGVKKKPQVLENLGL
jgi:hypothetical protein